MQVLACPQSMHIAFPVLCSSLNCKHLPSTIHTLCFPISFAPSCCTFNIKFVSCQLDALHPPQKSQIMCSTTNLQSDIDQSRQCCNLGIIDLTFAIKAVKYIHCFITNCNSHISKSATSGQMCQLVPTSLCCVS